MILNNIFCNYNISDIVKELKASMGIGLSLSQYSGNKSFSEEAIDLFQELVNQFKHNLFLSKNETYGPHSSEVWKDFNLVFREIISILEGYYSYYVKKISKIT